MHLIQGCTAWLSRSLFDWAPRNSQQLGMMDLSMAQPLQGNVRMRYLGEMARMCMLDVSARLWPCGTTLWQDFSHAAHFVPMCKPGGTDLWQPSLAVQICA